MVDTINEFRLIIKDKSKSIEERRFALRFLVHCFEDMHQPCHYGDNKDRGGNNTQVRFYDRGTYMDRLWDSDRLARVSQSKDVWLKDLATLDTQEAREPAAKGTPEDWATESLQTALLLGHLEIIQQRPSDDRQDQIRISELTAEPGGSG